MLTLIVRGESFDPAMLRLAEPVRTHVVDLWGEWRRTVRQRRPLCLFCDHEFMSRRAPSAFVFAVPHLGGAHRIIAGICAACCEQSDDELFALAQRQFRKLWADVRIIDGGRA